MKHNVKYKYIIGDYTKETEGEYDFITAYDTSNTQYKYYAR